MSFEQFERAGGKRKFFDLEDSSSTRRRLEEIVGPLSDEQFQDLEAIARNDFQQAVNKFFDTRPLSQPQKNRRVSVASERSTEQRPQHKKTKNDGSDEVEVPTEKVAQSYLPKSGKFLGSFQADIWSTRSGRNLVKYGDRLTIERLPVERSSNLKEDYILRVFNQGHDFARIREVDAKFMAILVDTRVARFEATCIYADEALRTGCSIIVQIDCYLLPDAFGDSLLHPRSSTIVQAKSALPGKSEESSVEKTMRFRQLGLIQLLMRLGLTHMVPDKVQAVVELNSSQTLDAQEMTESDKTEITQDQLCDLYNAAQGKSQTEIDPGPTFALDLYDYQKRGLRWMLEREAGTGTQSELHPLWTEFKWHDGSSFYVNLHSGDLSLKKPVLESTNVGGILADEMGLGKTISVLALVHTGFGQSTLVVAPLSLLTQWEEEIARASEPFTCDSFVYYNSNVGRLREFLLSKSERKKVVLTSYGQLVSEHKTLIEFRTKHGAEFTSHVRAHDRGLLGLYGFQFDRIVLDEAHEIRNRTTDRAHACYDIEGVKRWALTGTPVVNRLDDLYSFVKFLKVEPWDNFSFWRAFISLPFDNPAETHKAFKVVRAILAPLLLRRTKSMEHNGARLIELPPKQVDLKLLDFSPEERDLYTLYYTRIRCTVEKSINTGVASRSYTAIFALITRLRQLCDHPLLISRNKDAQVEGFKDIESEGVADTIEKFEPESFDSEPYPASVLDEIGKGTSHICPICTETIVPENFALTQCYHPCCLSCVLLAIKYARDQGEEPKCPICRAGIDAKKLLVLAHLKGRPRLRRYKRGQQSTKVKALLHELRTEPPGKCLVFSQFTSFLDLLQVELSAAGYEHLRFDGKLTQRSRMEVLDQFQRSRKPLVLLMSLKAGGVGLNLVCTQRAYFMDPWWNHADESQAIGRVHRMGQTEPVRIVRFIVRNTIEERILQIQERKRALENVMEGQGRTPGLQDFRTLLDLD